MGLPGFSLLSQNYPNGTADEVKGLIGGHVNAGWITNTCVIRLSRALNYAGARITTHAGLSTVSGSDGYRYAYRVSEFKVYMEHEYGPANIVGTGGDIAKFMGKQGVIMFDDCGWSDASGHFDLWNGNDCVHEGYWSRAAHVKLWECGS
jgi:hypothetical protein